MKFELNSDQLCLTISALKVMYNSAVDMVDFYSSAEHFDKAQLDYSLDLVERIKSLIEFYSSNGVF